MAKGKNPNREKAFTIYKESEGRIKLKLIADELGEKITNIYSWKRKDKWKENLKGKPGAPQGNRNAVGNKGGAPDGNLNAFKDGSYIPEERFVSKKFLAKYMPKVTQTIMNELEESGMNSLDILWTNIQIQFATLIRSQKIMHVTSKGEMIKELKKEKIESENHGKGKEIKMVEVLNEKEYEFQFAWDRQATLINSQAKGMQTLNNMIKTYEELLHKNWGLASEEQKLRVEKLKAELNQLGGNDNDPNKNNMDKLNSVLDQLESKN